MSYHTQTAIIAIAITVILGLVGIYFIIRLSKRAQAAGAPSKESPLTQKLTYVLPLLGALIVITVLTGPLSFAKIGALLAIVLAMLALVFYILWKRAQPA